MDDIEKLKAENSDLRTKVDNFERNEYKLIRELEKASETNERLLRILENLSNGYVKKGEVIMQYIKAKFPNSTRSYVYRTEDSVKAGDTGYKCQWCKADCYG